MPGKWFGTTYQGDDADETAGGTKLDEILNGLGGNDRLDGAGGRDKIVGGLGNDILNGGTGGDYIEGDPGDDVVYGGDGNDNLTGGTSDQYADWRDLPTGNDTLDGGKGDDGLAGADGFDILRGGVGDDVLVWGGIRAASGIDYDLDRFDGGTGIDALEVKMRAPSTKMVSVSLAKMTAENVLILEGRSLEYLNASIVVQDGGSVSVTGAERRDDVVTDDSFRPIYFSNDVVASFGGDDRIDVGKGADRVDAGKGDDHVTVRVDGRADKVLAGAGEDTLALQTGFVDGDKVTGRSVYDLGAGNDLLIFTEEGRGYTAKGELIALSGNTISRGGVVVGTVKGFESILYYGSDAVGTTFKGTAVADRVNMQGGNDVVAGGKGNDDIDGGLGSDTLDGGEGVDLLNFGALTVLDGVTVTLAGSRYATAVGKRYLDGGTERDKVKNFENVDGTIGKDKITGDAKDNVIQGFADDDTLNGGAGDDVLAGGGEADKLYGGTGKDTFRYEFEYDSGTTKAEQDTIYDFTKGDRFDLSEMDANIKTAKNDAFKWIGTAKFHGKASELRFEKAKSDTYVYADTNGDKKADFAVHLDDAVKLVGGDFLL